MSSIRNLARREAPQARDGTSVSVRAPKARAGTRLLVAAAVSAAAFLGVAAPRTSAGSLAPADVSLDIAGTIGPFWGNDGGTLLYARGVGTGQELMRRGLGEFPDTIAAAGDTNRFQVGFETERWVRFYSGAMNDKDDCAFVASTTIRDDSQTIEDESVARKGAYAFRGNTTYELGRYGGPSPIPTGFGDFIPWASFFDAVPLGRGDAGGLRVVFSAEVGAPADPNRRFGLFLWSESTGQSVPLVLSGDASPAGGPYKTITSVRCNEAGDVVFYALTQILSTAPVAPGLFRIAAADVHETPVVTRVVKFGNEGDTHAGVGRLSLLLDFDVDDAGNVVFTSRVEDGAAAPTALLRWEAGVVSIVLKQGQTTPLGGAYGSFSQAQVRSDESGTATFMVPLTGAVRGVGLFSVARGATVAEPLGVVDDPLVLASTGAGRVAYQTSSRTRTILPSDGSAEGPKDFRVALVDLRNSGAIAKDVMKADLRFRLAPWGAGAGQLPAAVFATDAVRNAPDHRLAPAELARIAEVNLQISESPGQAFTFGIGGTDTKPTGYVSVNGPLGFVTKLVVAKTRDTAKWTWKHAIGRGTFSINLTTGVAKLAVSKGSFFPSFDAFSFPVEMTLRTDADVAADRTGAAAYWFRKVRLDANQPNYPNGRRVLARGERLSGGTFFVDQLRVDRSLRVIRRQAAPRVTSDRVRLSGTLRLSPGSTPPSTPILSADITIGDLVLTDFPLRRVGKKGSRYTGRRTVLGVVATLTVDTQRASFSFSATKVPPLSQLVDADFLATTGSNSSKKRVGGMTLPVSISIDRVYESVSDFAMTRLPGGKVFVR